MTQQKLILGLIKKALKRKFKKDPEAVIFETTDFKNIVAFVNFTDGTKEQADATKDVSSLTEIISDRVETELKKIGVQKADYTTLKLDFLDSQLRLTIYYTDKENEKQFLTVKNII